MTEYTCRQCQTTQSDTPLCFGPDAPVAWDSLPIAERVQRAKLTDEVCEIDASQFFIRGCLDLPIHASTQPFTWLVWSSLSEAKFKRARALWHSAARVGEQPYFGWLNSALPGYPSTLNLKVHVHTRAVGQRPLIELEPTDHPLALEQREGITWARVHDIIHLMRGHGA